MRLPLLVLYLIFLVQGFAQQSKIYGTVSILNSKSNTGKVRPVKLASIEWAEGTRLGSPEVTDDDGKFSMTFIKLKIGETAHLIVKKIGFEVANFDALTVVAGQKEKVNILLVSSELLRKVRDSIYKVGSQAIIEPLQIQNKEYKKELKALKIQSKSAGERIQFLTSRIMYLEAQINQKDSLLRNFADQYARVDLDNGTSLFANAIEALKRGSLDSAATILQDGNLIKKADQIYDTQVKTARNVRNTSQDLILFIDICQLRNQYDSSYLLIKSLIKIDSINPRNQAILGDYYLQMDSISDAIRIYNKALKLADGKAITHSILLNMSSVYERTGNFIVADSLLSLALEIRKRTSDENPDFYARDIITLLTNIALSNFRSGNVYASDSLIIQVDTLNKKVKPFSFQDYVRWQSSVWVNSGLIYKEMYKIPLAEDRLLRGAELIENSGDSSARLLSILGFAYDILGGLYIDIKQFAAAELFLNKSLKINESLPLSISRSSRYYQESIISRIGIAETEQRKFEKAKNHFLNAISIIQNNCVMDTVSCNISTMRVSRNIMNWALYTRDFSFSDRYVELGYERGKKVHKQSSELKGEFHQYLLMMEHYYRAHSMPVLAQHYSDEATSLFGVPSGLILENHMN